MAKGKLFQFAVLYHPNPTKEQTDRGESPKSEVIVEPSTLLAISEQQASVIAARKIPNNHIEHVEQLEIVIRPF
jgi:hypothetical protein